MTMNKNYFYWLSGILILFTILILILCFYFRISTDDYLYIAETNKIGVIKVVKDIYLKWSGRYTAYAMSNTLYKIFGANQHYFFLVPLCSFIALFAGIYRAAGILLHQFSIESTGFKRSLISASFLALLFFLSFDIGETWFWCCSMAGYLFCIIAFVWGGSFILQPGSGIVTCLGIIICFSFIGGASEIYSFIFLIIFLFTLLFFNQLHTRPNSVSAGKENLSVRQRFKNNSYFRKLVIAISSLGLNFIIVIIAPGNYLRNQLLPNHRFFFSFLVTAKSFVKFFVLFIPLHFHFIFGFCMLFVVLGNELHGKKGMPEMCFNTFLKKTAIFFISILGIFFYTIAYIMSETGPARVWFLVSFLFSLYCCCISFYAGYCGLFSLKKLGTLKRCSLIVLFPTLSYMLFYQSMTVSYYATKYDEREQQLLKWKDEIHKDTLIRISSLPASGMLYPAEISADTNHFTNQHLRIFYNLPYHVAEN